MGNLGKIMAWGTVVAIGVVTTALAVWLIRSPQIVQDTPLESVVKHPGMVIGVAVLAILPWWTLVFSAIDSDSARSKGRKGPADWLSVMIVDRERHDKRW
ncbi:MAG TPA: hypothetical protein DCM28_08105 [Phycisphaerales bacterium]|nr:hypothetical protein [Phycisphaerales bacterium]HCD31092.1 hypothetical protein [Phycisphaerales bacterium]|tara:strand:+ start:151 stop:450 length:300 start_codon:yes stop_codon:yes gene_type:complete